MDAGQDEESEKPLDPTPRKLEQARRKGDIAKSNDLITAGSYAGFLLAFVVAASASLSGLGSALVWFLQQPERIAPLVFEGSAASALKGLAYHVPGFLVPWFLFPACLSLLAILVQRSFVITPSLLVPKLSRISLLANARQKFGRAGLFEFAKSLTKLVIYSVVLWIFLETHLHEMTLSLWTGPKVTMLLLADLVAAFLFTVLAVAVVIGLIDLVWQQQEHLRKNRMSFKEMRDEAKETEGDPYLKQERRQRGYDIATNRMMLDVPKADVVIVNPTHYAVALKWSRKRGEAPVCVAKGVDAVAARIRMLAAEHGVPMHRDAPAARALFATTDIGSEISPDHYRAVAAAIRFAETMRRKAVRRR
jgi:flagellar biosynthetic protein FlhB